MINLTKELPVFKPEDCKSCNFLGTHNGNDLYYCVDQATVISRYGEDGDYTSGLSFAKQDLYNNVDSAMAEALRRASNMKLIDLKIPNRILLSNNCIDRIETEMDFEHRYNCRLAETTTEFGKSHISVYRDNNTYQIVAVKVSRPESPVDYIEIV